jgi:hypothetical protein
MEGLTRRDVLIRATAAAGWAAAAAAAQEAPPGEREKVEAAIPDRPFAPPRKPRRLLLFDVNVGYGGHPSRFTANLAFELMGRRTGAFETTVSREPSVFERESLRRFDAVFLNNTVGNLFEDPGLRRNLVEFVVGGGGLLGVHGTTVAFTRWKEGGKEDWPEFGVMLGGRGANHRAADEHVFIRLDDPDHPVNGPFEGKGFDYRSEFFRVHAPYSRDRVRVLFSIDTAKTDLEQGPSYGKLRRPDDDYALAWVRSYGRGRVFYCTIGHAPSVFWDPTLLRFYLAAAQFAVGDLAAPTMPSARLTPAVRAQERLGWRPGLMARTGPLFEAADRAAKLGLPFLGASCAQPVSAEIPAPFDPRLPDDAVAQVRLKLDSAGVRLLSCEVPAIPADPEGARALFEFGRKLGLEAFVSGPPPEALEPLEKLCDEYDIRVAFPGGDPDRVLKACGGRSRRLGACGDAEEWARSGVDPLAAVKALGDRLVILRPGGKSEGLLREIRKLGIVPVLFGVDAVEPFNRVCLDLSPGGGR